MLKTASSLAVLIVVAGCARDCVKMFCGCWDKASWTATLLVRDAKSTPVPHAVLRCDGSAQPLGITDAAGIVEVKAMGRSSPGCGFVADCTISLQTTDTKNAIGSFNLSKLIRVNTMTSDGHRIEIVSQGT